MDTLLKYVIYGLGGFIGLLLINLSSKNRKLNKLSAKLKEGEDKEELRDVDGKLSESAALLKRLKREYEEVSRRNTDK